MPFPGVSGIGPPHTALAGLLGIVLLVFVLGLDGFTPSGSPCPSDGWTICLFAISPTHFVHLPSGFVCLLFVTCCLQLHCVLCEVEHVTGKENIIALVYINDFSQRNNR